MFLKVLFVSALCAAAYGQTCELQGGTCKRAANNCAAGWNDKLTCSRNNRRCCGGRAPEPSCTAGDPREIPGQENCGVAMNNRIVNGQNADENEWPWQISLWHNSYGMHICGGSLVTDQWVVTAAHCVVGDRPSDLKVTLGEHRLNRNSGNEVERDVIDIVVHESYADSDPWPYDIALLKLASPVSLGTNFVKTVCIPPSTAEFTSADDCWITGWGDSRGTANENILQEIRADIRTNADCQAAWGRNSILDSHICNDDGTQGSCSGDSGGPMQCTRNGRFNLVGVVSWGSSTCTTAGLPGVYTRVTSYTDWLYCKLMADANAQKKSRYD